MLRPTGADSFRKLRGSLLVVPASMRQFVGRSPTMRRFVGWRVAVSWSLRGQFVVLRQRAIVACAQHGTATTSAQHLGKEPA